MIVVALLGVKARTDVAMAGEPPKVVRQLSQLVASAEACVSGEKLSMIRERKPRGEQAGARRNEHGALLNLECIVTRGRGFCASPLMKPSPLKASAHPL